ncbi:Glutathione transport system permease protein GsiC [Pseudobythopirellula maris]|uniref:Glutathione transport system permease protein GsiC n=1 Tax=Pseudobythopirellula maris TaxID=2527991 RepID=A0A5C5ZVT8_9BACT|nr:ABC transporter permease [Pseudobythopirellula maris]TWT91127.1 Glutathione transport system permease protein GsiC [Pseudobythopirellula maris]
MLNYLIRRLMIGAMTLAMITFVIFALVRNMPGTPLTLAEGGDPSRQMSPESLARLEKLYGLDKPWPQAYVVWIGNLVRGDMGRSISRKEPVAKLIGDRVPATLLLTVTSLVLTYLLAIPLGLWSTVKSNTAAERGMSTVLYMLYSLPSFVAALYLQIVFAVKLGWMPLTGIVDTQTYESLSFWGKTLDVAHHAILPVACFTYGSLAYYTRFIKANMEEAIRQDYVRTARAKGLSPARVIVHHAFRNTLIPLVTLMGLTLPSLLSGGIILERIFAWPGMGTLFFESIGERDYPTIMGLTLVFSLLTLVGQLLADILYAVVDPRVTYH